jgi:predicted nuclease of predicted toxin-antitoxin system
MKLLIDVNLSPSWVAYLKTYSIESIHWTQVGNANDPDELLFDWAMTHGFVVFTNDLDFGAILAATNARGPSVIQLRVQDVLPPSLGPRLIAILERFGRELHEGALISVDVAREKVRILPIHR